MNRETDENAGSQGESAEAAEESLEPQTQEPTPEERLEEALREVEQFREMHKRSQADLVNYRRRAEEERESVRKYGKSQLLASSLPVIDDLERALSLVPEDAVAPGWLEGLQLVSRKMRQWLESEGVTKIEANGVPFSPTEHEAVGYEPASDEVEEGHVVTVIREGYKLHDRVLRASQVTVAMPGNED